MRLVLLILILSIAGCGIAAPVAPASLVGLSIADATNALGTPDSTVTSIAPPEWVGGAPSPTLVRPGDSYQALVYDNRGGRQLLIWAVAPATYEAIKGTNPGPDPYYVLEFHVAEGGIRY